MSSTENSPQKASPNPQLKTKPSLEQISQKFRRPQIVLTRNLRVPNYYTQAIDGEFSEFAFNEERVLTFKGQWRSVVFKQGQSYPVDLEIGTGNGVHFKHHALKFPERGLVGIELKYKPLIQSIRASLIAGCKNTRITRVHAFNVDQVFENGEINDIFVHFPDPWTTPRKPKNRVMNSRMLEIFWQLQRPGTRLEFKTDSREMFLWSLKQIKESRYSIEFETLDLHQSAMAHENVITGFEKIFIAQNILINFVRLRKI